MGRLSCGFVDFGSRLDQACGGVVASAGQGVMAAILFASCEIRATASSVLRWIPTVVGCFMFLQVAFCQRTVSLQLCERLLLCRNGARMREREREHRKTTVSFLAFHFPVAVLVLVASLCDDVTTDDAIGLTWWRQHLRGVFADSR